MHSKKSFALHLFKSMFYNCPTDFEYSLKHYQFSETYWYGYFNIVFRKQLPPLQQVFGTKKHGLKAAKILQFPPQDSQYVAQTAPSTSY